MTLLHADAPARQTFGRRLDAATPGQALDRLMRRVEQWFRRAQGRRQLAQLSDRELRDIGLSRFEARREVEKPFWAA